MATNRYVTLTNSNESYSKRFIATQMAPVLERSDDIQRTLSGTMDKSAGAITALHQYIFRVLAEEPDPEFGNKLDLEYFFKLNNPNGTPSDKITLTDHYGDDKECLFMGNMSPENVTTVLEGPNAIFLVKVALGEIAALSEDDTPSG